MSPASRRAGFTCRREPIIIAKGRPRSAQTGRTTFSSIVCPARATGVGRVGRVAEFRRQADGQVDRLLPIDPVAQEPPGFLDRCGR